MSAELELRWLKTYKVRGAAKCFTEFCKEDIIKQAEMDGFDIDKYQAAIHVVLEKLRDSNSVEGLFNVD